MSLPSLSITKSIKYIFLYVLLAACYLLLATGAANAQAIEEPANQTSLYTNVNDDVPRDFRTLSQNTIIEVGAGLVCQLTGIDPARPDQPCLGVDPKTGKIGFVQNSNGVISIVGNMIAATFTPPIHTSDYISYLSQNFGIVKPAYAADGFTGLKPLLGVWSIFRNMVYALMVIAFVVIGLAIMLRIKIDPRTVMSVENQIPKMIIAIVLVTFSFAIAGLMIDVMYISIYIVFNAFMDKNIFVNPSTYNSFIQGIDKTQRTFQGDNPFGVMSNLVNFNAIVLNGAGSIGDIVGSILNTGTDYRLSHFISNPGLPNSSPNEDSWIGSIPLIGQSLNAILATAFDSIRNVVGYLFSWIASILALLIIACALIYSMFRLWFQLIMAYVYFLLAVVLAPFWILMGLFPGSPISFGMWFREILSQLSVFPTTIAMFLLGKVFIEAFSGMDTSVFMPPLVGNLTPQGGSNPISGATPLSPIGSVIGMGIIFITPSVTKMMKDLVKAPEFKYATAIGQAVGAGTGAIQAHKHAAGIGHTLYGLQYASGVRGLGWMKNFLPPAQGGAHPPQG